MLANIEAYNSMLTSAVKHFWSMRKNASRKQSGRGVIDQGNRSGVTAGKNLDGFRRNPKNNQGEIILFFGLRLRQFRVEHLFIFPKLPYQSD